MIQDPNASYLDKEAARQTIKLTVALEIAEVYDEAAKAPLPTDDIARQVAKPAVRELVGEKFVKETVEEAGEKVVREGLEGSINVARAAAKQGDEILPGLFMYTDPAAKTIEGYQTHHLWPKAMGGPQAGWTVCAKNYHAARGGIQKRLDDFLTGHLNMSLNDMRKWARQNPDQLLPLLRDFHEQEGIPFPY